MTLCMCVCVVSVFFCRERVRGCHHRCDLRGQRGEETKLAKGEEMVQVPLVDAEDLIVEWVGVDSLVGEGGRDDDLGTDCAVYDFFCDVSFEEFFNTDDICDGGEERTVEIVSNEVNLDIRFFVQGVAGKIRLG